MTMIRVIIADDHPVFRRGLRRALEGSGEVEVAAEAADGRAALDCARQLRPHVAIIDLQMPGLHGLELTRTIARELPDTGVLILTMSEDEATVWTALRAGARGYLLKNAEEEGIMRAVRAVAEGELVIGPGVTARVLGFFDRPAPSRATTGCWVQVTSTVTVSPTWSHATPRERCGCCRAPSRAMRHDG